MTAGEAVAVTVRWRPGVVERIGGLTAQAEFHPATSKAGTSAGSPQAVARLTAVDGRPLLWRGQATGLPPGDYQVRLSVSDPGIDTTGVTADVFVHPPTSGELNNLAADHSRLAELAVASGGEVVPLEQIDALAEVLVGTRSHQELTEDVLIWNHWTMLLGFFVLMTAEWVVRKVHGLP